MSFGSEPIYRLLLHTRKCWAEKSEFLTHGLKSHFKTAHVSMLSQPSYGEQADEV